MLIVESQNDMKQYYYHLRELIDSAKASLKEISIDYNSTVGPRTRKLLEISKQIIPLIELDYPKAAKVLQNAVHDITTFQNTINAYSFGDIRTAIKMLDVFFPPKLQDAPKVFISHSSKDETVVNSFVERILMLGCGFTRTEIFCTLDHTSIHTGDDFRTEIIENMKMCDFVLCMISENYKTSEVCQNEMGAAWTLNSVRVLPFKFPSLSFSEIGFLNVVKQCASIIDKTKLDELYEELCGFYNIKQDWCNFNKQKEDFVALVKKMSREEIRDKF
jgi:hypothetical protein